MNFEQKSLNRKKDNDSIASNGSLLAADALERATNKTKTNDIGNLNNDLHSNRSNVDFRSKNLSNSVIKQKADNKGIYPNRSIIDSYQSPKPIKYGISMYDPSINEDTLKNFFSVKLVKKNKPIITVNIH